MFLRKNRKSANGEVYEYWTLCETVRTELGPRQRVVATLGKLSEQDLAAGWEDIEALLEGRKPAPRQLLLEKTKVTPNPEACTQWELADLANLTVDVCVNLATCTWRWHFGDGLVSMICSPNSWTAAGKLFLGRRLLPC